MDEAAERLGIDRVEIRLRNLPEKGEVLIPGDTLTDGCWADVVQKAAAAVGWGNPLPPNRGRGISLGLKNSASASASFSIVRLHHDGSLSIMSHSDMGRVRHRCLPKLLLQELELFGTIVIGWRYAVVLLDAPPQPPSTVSWKCYSGGLSGDQVS